MYARVRLGGVGGDCVYATGDGGGCDLYGKEEDAGELHQVRCDGGRIISQGAHGANLWHLRPPDEGDRQGRGRYNHICGVLPQGVVGGEVSGTSVSDGSPWFGTAPRALHVPPLLVKGGGVTIGCRTAAPL